MSYFIYFSVNLDAGTPDDTEHCRAMTGRHIYVNDYLVWRHNDKHREKASNDTREKDDASTSLA